MIWRIPTRPTLAVIAIGAASLAACGGGSDDTGLASDAGSDEARTINIEMTDNKFSPDRLEVDAGETVRLVFTNAGDVRHDAFIGTEDAQAEHESEMRDADDTGGGHGDMDGMGDSDTAMGHDSTDDENGGITLEPGENGEISHTFAADDELLIGCHEPGHYDAGMTIAIDVV